jgi:hypothetical protein
MGSKSGVKNDPFLAKIGAGSYLFVVKKEESTQELISDSMCAFPVEK